MNKMNKIKLKLIEIAMKRIGIPANMSYNFYLRIINDFKFGKEITLKEKLWAYKRGFLASSINAYGLTQQNYKYYLSDVDYYKLYPIDKHFRHWIDDKLTMKYVLSSYSAFLPKYFCALKEGGFITPLIDGKDILTIDDLLRCIQCEKQIALKLTDSSAGVGFYKVGYHEQFEIDNQVVSDDDFVKFLKTLDNYLVTEYVIAHESIRKISSGALNTVRIMIINEDTKHPKITNSIVKFSTKASGQVDNISAGSIFADVNVLTGEFSNAKNFVDSFCFNCINHPDSKIELNGFLPNWQEMSEKLIEISQYLAPLTYLGYDIAITDEGFKIIEINSHQGIRMIQTFRPLLSENPAADFFIKALNKKKR